MSNTTVTRIAPGDVADRLTVELLSKLTNRDYAYVCNSPLLHSNPKDLIGWHNLSYESLDLCFSYPVINSRYVLFGSSDDYIQHYTKHDEEMIELFDSLSSVGREKVEQFMLQLCPRLEWAKSVSDKNPTLRIRKYIQAIGREGFRRPNAEFIVREDISNRDECVELVRVMLIRGKFGKFKTDDLITISCGIGVSAHWVLGLTTPLFCKTKEAEQLFDLFTILPPQSQEIIYKTCKYANEKRKG